MRRAPRTSVREWMTLVYSGYCACELGGDGCGELTSGATGRVRYCRESRPAALSMTSLSMARPFLSSPCLEK